MKACSSYLLHDFHDTRGSFFLNGQRILQMGYWRNSPHRDTLAFRTGENPHLGPKPVNTRPKARQCGEVKPAQFKERTSDRRLLA
ncbi:hypothetical protein HanRHA438_Chr17g0829211 [Helianthus annuus]|nr:hypothetical protein HanRHA438_Chr17g0829211 [Helianthus annuus]